MHSIRKQITDAERALLKCGIDAPRLEAEVLLADAMGCSRSYLHAYPEAVVSKEVELAFCAFMTRRIEQEPLAYITGKREFCGYEFSVRPGVLIPRQETEHLVDLLVSSRPRVFADIGTGSGCIAISALKMLPDCHAVAVDISSDALCIANENARNLGVIDRLQLLHGSLCNPLQGQHFDAIVSNPPYIDWQDSDELPFEVSIWEPSEALYAGSQGLEFFPMIARQAQALLEPGGLLAFEVGINQAADVARIIADDCYETPQIICDYSGIERVVWTSKI
ncbi:MAG: peptide chain release factor N(5)-glutamine methyltransferase [Armatimonadota bacterium]